MCYEYIIIGSNPIPTCFLQIIIVFNFLKVFQIIIIKFIKIVKSVNYNINLL